MLPSRYRLFCGRFPAPRTMQQGSRVDRNRDVIFACSYLSRRGSAKVARGKSQRLDEKWFTIFKGSAKSSATFYS